MLQLKGFVLIFAIAVILRLIAQWQWRWISLSVLCLKRVGALASVLRGSHVG